MDFSFIYLSDRRLAKLSDISADIGTVIVASVVLPTIFNTTTEVSTTITGVLLVLLFWLISIVLLKT